MWGRREYATHGRDAHATQSHAACRVLFLVKGEVVIGDAEGEEGHGGGVGGAGALLVGGALGPGAIRALVLEERVAEFGVDAVPIFAAELVGGLGAVVDAVVIKFVAGVGEGIFEEVFAAGESFGKVGLLGRVLAEELEGERAGSGAGAIGAAAVLVAEAAPLLFGDGEPADVGDAFVEDFFGDGGATVGCAAQGHELPAGDGDVGIGAVDLVAPATGVRALRDFLRIENDFRGFGDGGFELGFAR